MKKFLPKEFWTIFRNSIHNAENEAQLNELQKSLDKLKNSGYVIITKYNLLCDDIEAKRFDFQPFE